MQSSFELFNKFHWEWNSPLTEMFAFSFLESSMKSETSLLVDYNFSFSSVVLDMNKSMMEKC